MLLVVAASQRTIAERDALHRPSLSHRLLHDVWDTTRTGSRLGVERTKPGGRIRWTAGCSELPLHRTKQPEQLIQQGYDLIQGVGAGKRAKQLTEQSTSWIRSYREHDAVEIDDKTQQFQMKWAQR